MEIAVSIVGVAHNDAAIVDAGSRARDLARQEGHPLPPIFLVPAESQRVLAGRIVGYSREPYDLAMLVDHHGGVPVRGRVPMGVTDFGRDAVLPQDGMPGRRRTHRFVTVAGNADDLTAVIERSGATRSIGSNQGKCSNLIPARDLPGETGYCVHRPYDSPTARALLAVLGCDITFRTYLTAGLV